MRRRVLDPTAGKTARGIHHRPNEADVADPTAGETARRSHREPAALRRSTDPTDPRCGQPPSLAEPDPAA
jgi:hypothetical protein